jgi:exopolyphosphatase / guanosine-5'-triphosphate,3'-diphosphate pyrophosphatase
MLERSVEEVKSKLNPGELLQMVGTSGTIETLASLNAREKTGAVPAPLTGYSLPLKDIRDWVSRLRRMNHAERLAIPGISERRAEILLAGALILQEAMTLLGIDRLTVCERSLREGIVVDWMLTRGLIEDRFRYQASVRQRSVLKTAKKYRVNLDHSERIAKFAVNLFDQTQSLHHLGPGPKKLLWAAAILHNSGHHVSHSAHHKHSYYLIRHSELLGYTEMEVETIANLARYHRKSPPRKKHDTYRNLTSKHHRRILEQLYPLLRIAVALDRRQVGGIEQVTCEIDSHRQTLKLHLTPAHPGDDCALELWNIGLAKGCFEQTYHLQIQAILTA